MKSKLKIGQAKCQYCGYITTTGGISKHTKNCFKNPDAVREPSPKGHVMTTKEYNKLPPIMQQFKQQFTTKEVIVGFAWFEVPCSDRLPDKENGYMVLINDKSNWFVSMYFNGTRFETAQYKTPFAWLEKRPLPVAALPDAIGLIEIEFKKWFSENEIESCNGGNLVAEYFKEFIKSIK